MDARLVAGPAAAVGAVLLWSTNAYAAGQVLAATTALQLLTVQYGAAAVTLIAAKGVLSRLRLATTTAPASLSGPSGRRKAVVLPQFVGVLGLTATIFLQYLAFDTAPLIGANVICYADGLIAAVWVAVRRPSRHAAAGLSLALLGFGGVVVVLTDGAGISGAAFGYLFALGSATCMAFYSLASGRSSGSTFDMLIPATVTGAVIAIGLSLLRGETWPPFADWAGAIYIGVGPMAAGYALWTYAMAGGRADRLIPLSYATPLVSTGLLLATGQPFTGRTLLGAALILLCSVGVLANQWHYQRHRQHPGLPTVPPGAPAADHPPADTPHHQHK